MDSIEKHTFREISPRVVAVADLKDDAAGLVKAREKGLFVTNDYIDLLGREDIDLIIELTGKQDVYEDILLKKKETVRAINHKTATLFWEFTLSSRIEQKARRKLQETRAIYNVLINELIQEDVIVAEVRVLKAVVVEEAHPSARGRFQLHLEIIAMCVLGAEAQAHLADSEAFRDDEGTHDRVGAGGGSVDSDRRRRDVLNCRECSPVRQPEVGQATLAVQTGLHLAEPQVVHGLH